MLKQLRSLCGALLLGKRRGTHASYERWLDEAQTALVRLEALRESIAHDQEFRRHARQHTPRSDGHQHAYHANAEWARWNVAFGF